ncbi:hypothetical protein I5421_22000 [Citrobacter braakii]|nr:hypothetical protein [Citrobacter braakii]MBJ8904258.1 hypothetical protein [Citrobacter braakii]MBJ8907553.1 hypothetical protein [Citrobacter braakii]MBJ8922940.1 hypothetical protein [Citrobacter braakii]
MKKKWIFFAGVFVLLSGCAQTTNSTKNVTQNKGATSNSLFSDRECINNFNVLQKVDPDKFMLYQKQFAEINKSYDFFDKNAMIMDKDPKELMSMEANSKLHLICSRVKNAAYAGIEKKMYAISQL